MSQINILNLTFAYDGSYDNIFEDVSFRIDTDWKLGFTGRNGRGKTTFLNLLCGKYKYKGSIASSVNFEYFPFDIADKTALTVDVADSVNPAYEQWELMKELSLLQVPDEVLYSPFDTLSNGEQTKVLLAILFLKQNSFLLIDEPTNHLDAGARKVVSDYLRSKKGFILVSHDRAFLDNCVDHILSIGKNDIDIQKGNFSSWWANKRMLDNFELAENEKLKKDIKRLTEAARRTAKWADKVESTKIGFDPVKEEKNIARRVVAGEKSRKLMQQSKNIAARQQKAIDQKSGLLKNIETADSLKIPHESFHSNRLASLKDVSIYYGDRKVCGGVNFEIENGERIALCGRNGCGKTSVIKLFCGGDIKYSGDFHKRNNLAISYVSQDTAFLRGDLTAFATENNIDESLFKAILRKLDFSRTQFDKDIAAFSEGQKKKVLIAKSLCEKANLYIWDEPLNFIDVLSRIQIEELLLNHALTILFVEHDAAFAQKIATKVVML